MNALSALSGEIEMDEAMFGGKVPARRGWVFHVPHRREAIHLRAYLRAHAGLFELGGRSCGDTTSPER
jgi:hypothetical protein